MNSHLLQGTVRLLQSQAEEAATVRDAAVAACSAATEQAEAAAADAAALLRTLRQQLDDARGHAAADAQRIAELSDKLQVDASPPGITWNVTWGTVRCAALDRLAAAGHPNIRIYVLYIVFRSRL